MEAVRGMVWIFSGIAQCDPIHCSLRGRRSKEEGKGDFGCERSARGARGKRKGNTCKNAIAFYVINIQQMNVKVLTGQASKHVSHSLNSFIKLVESTSCCFSNHIDLSIIIKYVVMASEA